LLIHHSLRLFCITPKSFQKRLQIIPV